MRRAAPCCWRCGHLLLLLCCVCEFCVLPSLFARTFVSVFMNERLYGGNRPPTRSSHTQASLAPFCLSVTKESRELEVGCLFLSLAISWSGLWLDNSSQDRAFCVTRVHTVKDRKRSCERSKLFVLRTITSLSARHMCSFLTHQFHLFACLLPPSIVCIQARYSLDKKESARGSRTREAISDVYQKVFRTHIIITSYSHTHTSVYGVPNTTEQQTQKSLDQQREWCVRDRETGKRVNLHVTWMKAVLLSLSPETNSALNTQTPGERAVDAVSAEEDSTPPLKMKTLSPGVCIWVVKHRVYEYYVCACMT